MDEAPLAVFLPAKVAAVSASLTSESSGLGWHPGQALPPADLPIPANWQMLPARAMPVEKGKTTAARWGNANYVRSTACDALAEARLLHDLIGPDVNHLRDLLVAVRLDKPVRAVKGGRVRYTVSGNTALWGLIDNGFSRGGREDGPPEPMAWHCRRFYDPKGILRYKECYDKSGRETSWRLYVYDAGVPVAHLDMADGALTGATAGLFEGNRLRMVAWFDKNLRLRHVYVLFYCGDRIEYGVRLKAREWRTGWLPEDGAKTMRLAAIEAYGIMHVWFAEDGTVRKIWMHRHAEPYTWPRSHN